MTQVHFIAAATRDMVVAAFFASLVFIAAYSALASWWRSSIGRALVAMDGSLALTLAPLAAHQVFGLTTTASAGFAWYYLVSISLVAASTLWRTWIIYRAQRPRRPAAGSAADPAQERTIR